MGDDGLSFIFRTFLALTGSIVLTGMLCPVNASANDCENTFFSTTTSNPQLLNRIRVGPKELSSLEQSLPPNLQPGGQLSFREQQLSGDPQKALIDFIGMLSANRQKSFSVKDFDRGGLNDGGTFTLGVPLVGKYSLEAIYSADFRHGEQYNLSQLKLIPPFGKALNISTNPLTTNGQLNPKLRFDLSMHPDLAPYSIVAGLPSTIDMNSLLKVEATKNQLNFVGKLEMRQIAQTNGYMKLRWLMLQRFVKAKMLEYHVKGIFKRYVALISAPLAIYIVYSLMPDGTIADIREFFTSPDPNLIDRVLTDLVDSNEIPVPIKDQLQALRDEVTSTIDPTGARSRELTRQSPGAIDVGSRFDISKNQSVWIQTVQDPKTRLSTTVLFLSRFNGSNQIDVAAIPIDPIRFQPLITFVEGRGEFLPNSREELKR